MSLRRYVNLVVRNCLDNTYHLRRIDIARLFSPSVAAKIGPAAPPPIEDRYLPEPTMRFYPPSGSDYGPTMGFVLINRKVVSMDHKGGATMYDPALHATRALPRLAPQPQESPTYLAKGNVLFVLDCRGRSFESLSRTASTCKYCKRDSWEWQTLPMPPFVLPEDTRVDSCALVDDDSHLWMSCSTNDGGNSCTYSFNTERLVWSSEQADWAMPFSGRAVYVPEHKLWFGVSSRDQGHFFCASDLAASTVQPGSSPPGLTTRASMDWHPLTAQAVHLGSGMFCIVKFLGVSTSRFVVFSGVEVKRSCDGGFVQIVEHKSERYLLPVSDSYYVL